MNRQQLDQRNADTIRKHYRALTDNSGQPSQQLLDDLAAIADEHRGEHAPVEIIPVEPKTVLPKSAPRRTPARRTVK